MTDFLPPDYEVPSSRENYMRFEEGDNKFRILCSPIIGWEAWVSDEQGGRKPIRQPMDKPFSVDQVDAPEDIKHFWAMVVYNYNLKKIQILEITQKGIQKSIKALARDEDWGTPLNYDLVVVREGKDKSTTYSLNPKPAKKIDPGIARLYKNMQIDLYALYEGKDPFANKEENISVDPKDVPEVF